MLVRCIKCSHFLLLFMTHKSDFVCISNSHSLYRYLSGKRETHDQSQHNHLSLSTRLLFSLYFFHSFCVRVSHASFSSNNKTVLLAEPVNLNYVTSGIVHCVLRHDVTGSKAAEKTRTTKSFKARSLHCFLPSVLLSLLQDFFLVFIFFLL